MIMKLRYLLLCFLSTILLASCGKDPLPEPEPQEVRFSVLGDSFSSLEGYVDPNTNDPWPNYSTIGVTGPEMMWWHQVADSTGWVMERNNSFSGSLVCNYDPNNYYGQHSYLRRMNDLGNPDVIFVFGATNDIYNRVPLGDYQYADWTEEQLCTFRPAMAYMLDNLKQLYPKARIYVMVDMELCINDSSIDDEVRQAYIESMHQVSNHYNVNTIDIYGIHKSWWHPDAKGQRDISRQVIAAVMAEINA